MRGWGTTASSVAASLRLLLLLLLLGVAGPAAHAYSLDPNSTDSVRTVASSMAADMMSFYNGDQPGNTPGLLPMPYYWWEAGAMMGALVDYWYYTGDTQYVNITQQGLLFQVGPNRDYMPPNQTRTEGNDDQGFWGFAAMSAAEYKFPDPPPDQPQWLALAQAVFNTMAARWDTADCNGGLRWQIFTWNNGYTYKNSISQACLFNMAARLALYTGNQTYADWAERAWDWTRAVNFMDDSYYIYDGADIGNNCTDIVPYQFSYSPGAFLLGAAAMYNQSSSAADQSKWKTRVDGLLSGIDVFFTGNDSNIMTEVACEPVNRCDTDQQSFKAYLSRWMAATTKWAPWTYDRVMPLLRASAAAAAAQCKGGANGRMCGLRWTDNGAWDGSTGVGQQMAAMEVVLANMIRQVSTPVTNATGGTSVGDPSAGGSDVGRTNPQSAVDFMPAITTGDRAGAYILTVAAVLGLVAGIVFVLLDETAEKMTAAERWLAFKNASAAAPAVIVRKLAWSDSSSASSGEEEKGKGVATAATAIPPVVEVDTPSRSRTLVSEHRRGLSDPGFSLPLPPDHSLSTSSSASSLSPTSLGHARSRSAVALPVTYTTAPPPLAAPSPARSRPVIPRRPVRLSYPASTRPPPSDQANSIYGRPGRPATMAYLPPRDGELP